MADLEYNEICFTVVPPGCMYLLHVMTYSSCNTEAETPNSETGMYTTFREHNISW